MCAVEEKEGGYNNISLMIHILFKHHVLKLFTKTETDPPLCHREFINKTEKSKKQLDVKVNQDNI